MRVRFMEKMYIGDFSDLGRLDKKFIGNGVGPH